MVFCLAKLLEFCLPTPTVPEDLVLSIGHTSLANLSREEPQISVMLGGDDASQDRILCHNWCIAI